MAIDDLERMAKAATYRVAREGRVFSSSGWRGSTERELQQLPNSHGYMRVRMMIDGRRASRFVHKLVAELFLPPRPSSTHEIRHLNGDRTDNRAENLAWGTRKENASDREVHGRTARGERNGFAKLSNNDRAEICFSDLPTTELATRYSVDKSTIIKIRNGKWT